MAVVDMGNFGVYFYLLGSLICYFSMVKRSPYVTRDAGLLVFVAMSVAMFVLCEMLNLQPYSR